MGHADDRSLCDLSNPATLPARQTRHAARDTVAPGPEGEDGDDDVSHLSAGPWKFEVKKKKKKKQKEYSGALAERLNKGAAVYA